MKTKTLYLIIIVFLSVVFCCNKDENNIDNLMNNTCYYYYPNGTSKIFNLINKELVDSFLFTITIYDPSWPGLTMPCKTYRIIAPEIQIINDTFSIEYVTEDTLSLEVNIEGSFENDYKEAKGSYSIKDIKYCGAMSVVFWEADLKSCMK